jgi:pimeloyl-ACP methyl ester carboxylesterase
MKTIASVTAVITALGLAAMATTAVRAEPSVSKPAPGVTAPQTTVVLVHGAFADGSSWNKIIPKLQAKGLKVVSVQNPLSSLADDVAATRRVLDVQTGPVVLVGHSWGGVVITQAGVHERVKSLVYVAAFAPSEGQSVNDLGKDYPRPSGLDHIVADKEGFLTLSFEGITKHFVQNLPAAEANLVAVTQGPIRGAAFGEKVSVAAWRTKPSWFVISEQDHMIQPALQKANAKKLSAHVVQLQTDHVPFLTKPTEVANAIIAAAEASPTKPAGTAR